MTRRILAVALAGGLLLSACSAADSGTAPPTTATSSGSSLTSATASRGGGDRAADPAQQGADTLLRALALLRERYPEGADTGRLVAAAQQGAWHALAQVGLAPRDVDLPGPRASLAETPQALAARYRRMAASYSSKVDSQWLAHEMIRRMANSFEDCHTGFLSPEQARDHVNRLQGNNRFVGVGVSLRRNVEGEGFPIIEVFDDGPAARAGLRRGDRLVSVDGQDLKGLGLEQVVALVRGQEGTGVRLGVRRGDAAREFEVARGRVSAPFIKAAIVSGNLGYLHLYSFPEPLVEQVDQALSEFGRRNVAGVVLDLRDNSGGQLDIVTRVASRFVKSGALFRTVVPGGDRTLYHADGSHWSAAKPIAVLVNGGTGSGGEIVASAIQEHRVGRLIGTRTAGCVSTGQIFPLPDGSAIEIATSRVFTGLRGAELNRVGVQPDEVVELTTGDLVEDRDPQLERAAELLLGR